MKLKKSMLLGLLAGILVVSAAGCQAAKSKSQKETKSSQSDSNSASDEAPSVSPGG